MPAGILNQRFGATAAAAAFYAGYNPAVCYLGDSIGAGHPDFTGPHESGGPTGDQTNEIWYWLKQSSMYGSGFTYDNFCVGGSKISDVVSGQLSGAAAATPRFFHIVCGVNDIANSVSAATMKSGLDTIYAARPNGSYLFINEVLPWTAGDDTYAGTIRTWNTTELPGWASGKNVRIVRCHDQIARLRVSTGQQDNLIADCDADGIHLQKPTGPKVIASLVKAAYDSHFA